MNHVSHEKLQIWRATAGHIFRPPEFEQIKGSEEIQVLRLVYAEALQLSLAGKLVSPT